MNVATIDIEPDAAKFHYEQYKAALENREATEEDTQILLGYKALAAGKELIDLHHAFRNCPLDANGLPKFAVGRASWEWCHYCLDGNRAAFAPSRAMLGRRGNTGKVTVPRRMMPTAAKLLSTWEGRRALVPLIPATIRPKGDLSKYHVLWEAEWQPVAPTDPILLKHLTGSLYVILAAWDLTELERAVLAGRLAEGQQ
jgi:hypothetical protein